MHCYHYQKKKKKNLLPHNTAASWASTNLFQGSFVTSCWLLWNRIITPTRAGSLRQIWCFVSKKGVSCAVSHLKLNHIFEWPGSISFERILCSLVARFKWLCTRCALQLWAAVVGLLVRLYPDASFFFRTNACRDRTLKQAHGLNTLKLSNGCLAKRSTVCKRCLMNGACRTTSG